MMFGSQFDGAAAFSGGGFMPSQTAQAADPSAFSPAKVIRRTTFPLYLTLELNVVLLSSISLCTISRTSVRG